MRRKAEGMGEGEAIESAAPPMSEGWTQRFTAMGARLHEAVELYRGLGYEVRLGPANPSPEEMQPGSGCEQCVVMTLARSIYTRQPR